MRWHFDAYFYSSRVPNDPYNYDQASAGHLLDNIVGLRESLVLIESHLIAERAAGRFGLPARSELLEGRRPWVMARRPRGATEQTLGEVREHGAQIERLVTEMGSLFGTMNELAAAQVAQAASLATVSAAVDSVRFTLPELRRHTALISGAVGAVAREAVLGVLAGVPRNGLGHISPRQAAEALGASPEQLDRFFPYPKDLGDSLGAVFAAEAKQQQSVLDPLPGEVTTA